MENDTNNVNQENIPEVFSSNPQTGNEPVEAVDSEQLVNMEVDVNKTVEVNTQVIPETGSEPVNVQPVEPTKKSNKWLVIIIVIILLALVGIGIYFF